MYKILAKTLFVAKKIIFLPSCHSTNEVASQLLETNAAQEGDVVITNDQTKGKGQRGNSWESEKGQNLTFSLILKPNFVLINEQFNLNIIVSLGIVDALNIIHPGFKVKWPNDIYYREKKVCGILIQNNIKGKQIDTTIIGAGINVNQAVFSEPKAISLKQITEDSYDLQQVLDSVLNHIEKRYLQLKNGQFSILKQEYMSMLYRLGETHLYKSEWAFRGEISGVSDDGRLEIETANGKRSFYFKEVEFTDDIAQ